MRLEIRSQYLTLTLALALAALALLPALARAGSSEIVYPEPGTAVNNPFEATEKQHPSPKGHSGPGASTTSPTPDKPTIEGETTESPSEPGGEAETSRREQAKAAPPGKGGNRPPGGGSHPGQKPGAKQPGGSPQASETHAQRPTTQTGVNASQSNGGSSPVVPILIAMAILAALSIGVVLYRERKGHPSASA